MPALFILRPEAQDLSPKPFPKQTLELEGEVPAKRSHAGFRVKKTVLRGSEFTIPSNHA